MRRLGPAASKRYRGRAMPDFSPTEYAVPGFVALVLIEMIWAWRRNPHAYEAKDTLTSPSVSVSRSAAVHPNWLMRLSTPTRRM